MTDWNDIVLWLLVALIVPACIWSGYTIASAELCRRRKHHTPARKAVQVEPFKRPIQTRQTPTMNPNVRGFDSPELFREDSVTRIQQLQKDILALRKND